MNQIFKQECSDYKDAESKFIELINTIEMAAPPKPLYFFAYKWLLNDAVRWFKNSDVIVVDHKGNMWQRGQKLEERYR